MNQRLGEYSELLRRGFKMFNEMRYEPVSQSLGKQYRPHEVHGYYIDLSHKAFWKGEYDSDGLPLDRDGRGAGVVMPTTVIQKGLGHWEQWLAHGDIYHLKQAQILVDWLVAQQDAQGGWSSSFDWRIPQDRLVPYSASTQGEAASFLLRVFVRSGKNVYQDSAQRALDLMLVAVEDGGTARYWGDGEQLFLDEFPQNLMSIVLNGWIFALYGLVDFVQLDPIPSYVNALERTLLTLIAQLERYDLGFWSQYDSRGTIASPFYHDLHIAQIEALALTFPEHALTFNQIHGTWSEYRKNPFNYARAVGTKTLQELQRRPRIVTH